MVSRLEASADHARLHSRGPQELGRTDRLISDELLLQREDGEKKSLFPLNAISISLFVCERACISVDELCFLGWAFKG